MFVKQSQAPARRNAAQESVGLLEEMSPAAEPGTVEAAAQPRPSRWLPVKPELRELPLMGESNQCPEWVSPGEQGAGAGSGGRGRPADGWGCMDAVVAPLHAPPWWGISARDTWVLVRVCSGPALCLYWNKKNPSRIPAQHVSPSRLRRGAWWICKPGCVGATPAASSR